MEGSNIGFQKWAMSLYLIATSLKGISSMKLHREIGVTQKTAWHLMHRIREAFDEDPDPGSGFLGRSRSTKPISAARRATNTPTRSFTPDVAP